MSKSKINTEIMEALVSARKWAAIKASSFEHPSTHPTLKRLYETAMRPDIERLRKALAEDIISGTEEEWKACFKPDDEGRVANLFMLDYDIGQSYGGWAGAYYFSQRIGPRNHIDTHEKRLVSVRHAEGIGGFCLQPFDQFIEAFRAEHEVFEDIDVFWKAANLMVATSHVIAHLAFQDLEDRAAFKGRGMPRPTYFATKEHGEGVAHVIFAVG